MKADKIKFSLTLLKGENIVCHRYSSTDPDESIGSNLMDVANIIHNYLDSGKGKFTHQLTLKLDYQDQITTIENIIVKTEKYKIDIKPIMRDIFKTLTKTNNIIYSNL